MAWSVFVRGFVSAFSSRLNFQTASRRQHFAWHWRSRWVAAAVAAACLAGLAPSLAAQTAYFAGAQTTLASGLSNPEGVAIDASGDVFFTGYSGGLGMTTGYVDEIPAGCTSSSCVTTVVSSGLSLPAGIAVDKNGNLYVADNSNQALYKFALSGGSYSSAITIANRSSSPPLSSEDGVAVDANCSVYVTEQQGPSGNVYEYQTNTGTCAGTSYTAPVTVASLNDPVGVAVDASGNVYVSVIGNSAVYKYTPNAIGGFNQSTVASSISDPGLVAVDALGNVYVGSYPGSVVLQYSPDGSGGYVQTTLGSGFSAAAGIAVDGKGDVYVTDNINGAVYEVQTQGVNLGSTAVGATSSAQTLLFNFTNATAATIGAPVALTQGAAGLDFTDAGTGSCDTDATDSTLLSAGDTCTVNVTFKPQYAGTRDGAVELVNSSGTVIATAYVYGTGTGPQLTFSPPTQSTIGSGLGQPDGVAVDGSGNVYIADTGNSRVLKETLSAGNYTQSTISGSLGNPFDVAVDGSGNVYIADTYDGRVVKETLSAGSYTLSTIASGLGDPSGVAVDGSGNVYIADANNNRVLKETLSGGSYTQSTIGSGLSAPTDVAVDGSGNVYIADSSNSRVLKETLSGGSYTQSTIGSGLNVPSGVAVDGSGNVYIADTGNNRVVKENVADAPSLSFATTVANSGNSSDSPQTVTVTNNGNALLTFKLPTASGAYNPSISSNFLYDNSSTCEQTSSSSGTAYTLDAGVSCDIAVDFAPTTSGSISGSVVLTDNNLNNLNVTPPNNATQTISLSGTGTYGAASQLVVTAPPTTTVGTAFRVIVTAEDQYGNTVLNDSDQIGLYVDGNAEGVFNLNSGTLSTNVILTTAGVNTITAVDSSNGAIRGSTQVTADPGRATSLAASAGTPQSAYVNVAFATQLTATVTDTYGNSVSGLTVNFTAPPSGASATLSVPSCTTAANGSCSVTATANGTTGTYNVTAAVSGLTGVSFALTNNLPPNYVVNTNGDDAGGVASNCSVGGGSGTCTLRDALTAAAAIGTGNITFDSTAFASAQTITLTNGTLSVPTNTTITGPGASILAISGNNAVQVFNIASGVTASISGVTVEDGLSTASSISGVGGAGVINNGTLTLSSCVVTGNQSSNGGPGAGIGNLGILTVRQCTISNNTATGTLAGGTAAGGGLFNIGTATIMDSTFSGNTAAGGTANVGGIGGAIYDAGSLTITGSTLNGNRVTDPNGTGAAGGAIAAGGGPLLNTLTITNSTIYGNSAIGTVSIDRVGGILQAGIAQITLNNTILAGNTDSGGYPDGYGNLSLSSNSHNLIGNGNGIYGITNGSNGNIVGSSASPINPELSQLGSYGGPTQTMILLPGSAAICAGSYSSAQSAGIGSDQRGVAFGNTGAGGYCPAGSIDAGAVQTDYALSFSTEPEPISPAASIVPDASFEAAVTLTESGTAFTGVSVNIPLALTSTPSGATLSNGTESTSTGIATYSTLQVNETGTDDTLTANLTLNSGLTPALALSATSSQFSVGQATPTLTFAPSPATQTYGTPITIVSLNASASYLGSTVNGTLAYTTTVNGNTVTLMSGTTVLPAGTYTITAIFTPSDAAVYTGASTTARYTVTQAASATTLSASGTSITPGQSVTLTATVADASAGSTGTPTGTVSFYDNGTPLNATPVALSGGVATYSTASLASGASNVITATYLGDTNFTGSSSTTGTTIAEASLDFTMTLIGPANLTVVPGQSVSYQVQVTPLYGSYAGTVNFAISGLPPGATVAFSPASIAANGGTQTVTVTITSAPATAALHREPPSNGRRLAPFALGFLFLFGAGSLRKRGRVLRGLLCVLALAGAGAVAGMLSGCGSNEGFFAQAQQDYTVTVTATAGNLQHSSTITLNVQ